MLKEPIRMNPQVVSSRSHQHLSGTPGSQKDPKVQFKPLAPRDFYFAGPGLESPAGYRPGGYHPVHIGDIYREKYRVLHKLGYGTYSTVWLARDLSFPSPTRYVSLKFVVSELTGRNNEIKIYHHLATKPIRTRSGSEHVLGLLDQFKVRGVNGEHDVLVLPVIGPHLGDMFDEESGIIQKSIKSLVRQIALGTSFMHGCGIVHGDLHKGNVAFEISGLDGEPERNVYLTLGSPECVPTLTQNLQSPMNMLPEYLVRPGNLSDFVTRDNLRIKIIDLGEAFSVTKPPQELHTPLAVRAPEAIINHFSKSLKIPYGPQVDIWSIGCLIYELATSSSLTGYTRDEGKALRELMTLLGPVPQEWVDSLEEPLPPGYDDAPLEDTIQAYSEVDDTPELATLLRKILVFEPSKRLSASEIPDHPWFGTS